MTPDEYSRWLVEQDRLYAMTVQADWSEQERDAQMARYFERERVQELADAHMAQVEQEEADARMSRDFERQRVQELADALLATRLTEQVE